MDIINSTKIFTSKQKLKNIQNINWKGLLILRYRYQNSLFFFNGMIHLLNSNNLLIIRF